MLERSTIESLDREELIELVLKLAAQVEELQKRVDELTRSGKRQATPFSKQKRKPNPKPPGRKPGQGPFTNRTAPDPSTYSAPPEHVPVTEPSCPDCGGRLEADGEETVTVTEIAPQPKPEVRAYRVQMCRCAECGKRVRGRHPDVAVDQHGATAHRVGDRAMATAHWMHYGIGIPVRKIPGLFKELYGLDLTQSAITQDALRRGRTTLASAYEQVRQAVAASGRVNTDDTSWRINGVSAWLMTFSTPSEALYQIRRHHGKREVLEGIGTSYKGVMNTDRFGSYDAKEFSTVRQQKCLSHIHIDLTELIEKQRGRAGALPRRLKDIFKEAMELWRVRATLKDFPQRAMKIQREVDWLLRPRRLRNEANNRMVRELGWHNDGGNLLRFLHEPEEATPTNNEAERALRPAVIARKVSHCSKNDAGAEAHATFASIIGTAVKRGARSVVDALRRVFATGEIPASFAE